MTAEPTTVAIATHPSPDSAVAPPQPTPLHVLAPLVLPALAVGVFSSVLLIGVTWVAERLHELLWNVAPPWVGASCTSPVWIVPMLTLTGVAVGLVVWLVPGHAGPDPATTGLVEAPLAPGILPSLLVALVLMLAGGVSLGPENPIMAINTGLIFAVGARVLPAIGAPAWVGLSSAGMLGAMFGTPVRGGLDSVGVHFW